MLLSIFTDSYNYMGLAQTIYSSFKILLDGNKIFCRVTMKSVAICKTLAIPIA